MNKSEVEMKFENGQKVFYEINERKYPGVIKKTNVKSMPYKIKFIEEPVIDGLVINSLIVHKKNLGKIIGSNIFKNE